MPPVPGIPSDILVLAGPLFLGYCFNWGLFGILCMQMYMYHLGFPDDILFVKVLVYGLFVIDTVQTALTTHNGWHFLVRGWGVSEALIKPGWSWIAVPLLSGVVSATVQIFFAWRIRRLSGKVWVAIPIVIGALMQGISAAVCGIWFEIVDDVTKISSLDAPATVWLAGSAGTDILIAVTMVILLRKSASGFENTDRMIRRLIRMTVETGSITALAAIAELVLYLRFKENNLHMIPALALSKLYSNTLMATLNSRNPQYRTTSEFVSGRARTLNSNVIQVSGPKDTLAAGNRYNANTRGVTSISDDLDTYSMDMGHGITSGGGAGAARRRTLGYGPPQTPTFTIPHFTARTVPVSGAAANAAVNEEEVGTPMDEFKGGDKMAEADEESLEEEEESVSKGGSSMRAGEEERERERERELVRYELTGNAAVIEGGSATGKGHAS